METVNELSPLYISRRQLRCTTRSIIISVCCAAAAAAAAAHVSAASTNSFAGCSTDHLGLTSDADLTAAAAVANVFIQVVAERRQMFVHNCFLYIDILYSSKNNCHNIRENCIAPPPKKNKQYVITARICQSQ